MALTAEDLAAIAGALKPMVEDIVSDRVAAQPKATENHGEPDAANSLDGAPVYYVHLANGNVIETQDAGSTHMDVDGESVQVIGRFQKGN
jgi:hypothetical protein